MNNSYLLMMSDVRNEKLSILFDPPILLPTNTGEQNFRTLLLVLSVKQTSTKSRTII
jgi:hypothetical protein